MMTSPETALATARPFAGRRALVTGSTSGIGLGIAREAVIRDILLAQQPNKRFATVEEIGAVTAFLCGGEAASITGAALAVDGGWTVH